MAGPRIPDSAWSDPDIQVSIVRWDFGLTSRLVRELSHLRQDDMAALTGLSQGFLSMLEAGARRLTNLDKVEQFLRGIGAPEALLPPSVRRHIAPPAPLILPAAGPHVPEEHTDLRALAAQAAAQSLDFAEATLHSNVTDESLEALAHVIGTIAKDYVHAPLHPLFKRLLATRNHIFELLDGRQAPRLARELHVLAGTSCLLLAHASQNLGDADAAMAQIQSAWKFAQQADHNDLRAWTKGTAALISEWSPQQHSALEYSREATALSPQGETRVRIAAIEARAAARAGDRETALLALDDLRSARDQRDSAESLSRFGGILTFPGAKQEYYLGGTYALLGEHALAEQHATAAIAMYESGPKRERSYGDEALARLDVVTSRIAADELEGASEQFLPLLELPHNLRIRQIGHAVRRVADLLEAPRLARSRSARELVEAARSYQASDTSPKAALS
ncbi:helix-turn-helix domain-containing protein [Streptomyces sp. NPDC006704]|uniref:helix-turn-helix domain-containing protein n=1 Tax=Streptomyces sp. NPDC006704 TaxID=3364760 RepID=UPI003685B179